MKKYVKPELAYENFELTQSVAATITCAIQFSHNDTNCEIKYRDPEALSFNNEDECDIGHIVDDVYCYTGHTGEYPSLLGIFVS